jgi:hypothetical protein
VSRYPLGAAALLVGAVSACAPLTATMATIAAGKAVYDEIGAVAAENAVIIQAACKRWDAKYTVATQKVAAGGVSQAGAAKLSALALTVKTACDPSNPPPSDPLLTAVWLVGICDQVDALLAAEAKTNPATATH